MLKISNFLAKVNVSLLVSSFNELLFYTAYNIFTFVFLTNAITRTGTERYVGVGMSSLRVLGTKTFRLKIVRIGKMMR